MIFARISVYNAMQTTSDDRILFFLSFLFFESTYQNFNRLQLKPILSAYWFGWPKKTPHHAEEAHGTRCSLHVAYPDGKRPREPQYEIFHIPCIGNRYIRFEVGVGVSWRCWLRGRALIRCNKTNEPRCYQNQSVCILLYRMLLASAFHLNSSRDVVVFSRQIIGMGLCLVEHAIRLIQRKQYYVYAFCFSGSMACKWILIGIISVVMFV